MSNFFSALFDRSFTSYVTRQVAGVLYLITMILVILGLVLGVIFAVLTMAQGGIFEGLLVLIATPLIALLTLILIRLVFESSVALVAIAENTKK